MTNPIAMTVSELREALDSRAVSSREITSAFLGQIERQRNLGAFIEVTSDIALRQADDADARLARGERGPMLGIPIAIKDLICTKGVKTTCASKMLANFVPPYDATVMTALNSAGAVMLGKTNMDEFAMGSSNENSAFGPALNPWDTSRVPGGSSGGSAAAVAACLAPVSLGSDTGGSIRQPAALCNLVGLKPTYGRVSRYGLIAFASSLDQIGAFTRTVRDNALITAVLAGKDPLDATSVERPVPDFVAAVDRPLKGLRIGLPREYKATAGIQPEVRDALQNAIQTFKDLGATIVEVSLPHAESGLSAYYIVAPAEAASNLSRFDGVRFGHRTAEPGSLRDLYSKSRSEGFGKEVRRRIMIGTYVLSSGYYDAYYVRAQKVRTLIAKDFEAAFSRDCDVILGPTSPTTAFKIGEKSADPLAMYLNDVFTIPVNLAGLPAMSIPGGFDKQGLPIGLHLIGKPFDEETLFTVAGGYEKATTWHTKLPRGILPT